jgi:molybdenum cofactor synthesis domain-containing protein
MLKINVEDAVGHCLGHDITEVDPVRKIKHRAFKRGQVIAAEDIERLRNLGKNAVYVIDGNNTGEVHEDDAAKECAPLIAGLNIDFDKEPVEGKINFYASINGLLKVDAERLYQINSLEIPSLPTLHTDSPVKKGDRVAAFRIIPLTCERAIIDNIIKQLQTPLIQIKPYIFKKAAVIVTGNEVFEGRISDGFIPLFNKKSVEYGLTLTATAILPDDRDKIAATLEEYSVTADIIFVTGGTSVDPDDVTVSALRQAGVIFEMQGNPLQPGNNLTIGYKNKAAVCAVPAAALFFKYTAVDIFLPRLMAGDKIHKSDLFRLGHGGLCRFCKICHFPVCPFGR